MQNLSIIIPVYNEKKTISKVLYKVRKLTIRGVTIETVIVDDCSSDSTREILQKIKDESIKIYYHKKNKGKGAAVRTALEHVKGDIIAIQDADLEYDPNNIKKLIKPILDGNSDIVYGSRFDGTKLVLFGKNKTPLPLHLIGNRFLTFLTNMLFSASITDMETGCKILKKNVLNDIRLRANGFDFEPEITSKMLKKGYKINEIPIEFNPRTVNDGKKITWKDGIKAAYYLFKYRFFD